MNNNRIIEIILSTKLASRLLTFFDLKDNFENGLNEFNMSLDKFYNNLIEEVIEILSDVLVDQYNILKEDGHINGETFDDRN